MGVGLFDRGGKTGVVVDRETGGCEDCSMLIGGLSTLKKKIIQKPIKTKRKVIITGLLLLLLVDLRAVLRDVLLLHAVVLLLLL